VQLAKVDALEGAVVAMAADNAAAAAALEDALGELTAAAADGMHMPPLPGAPAVLTRESADSCRATLACVADLLAAVRDPALVQLIMIRSSPKYAGVVLSVDSTLHFFRLCRRALIIPISLWRMNSFFGFRFVDRLVNSLEQQRSYVTKMTNNSNALESRVGAFPGRFRDAAPSFNLGCMSGLSVYLIEK
jgi:hypothetical protein